MSIKVIKVRKLKLYKSKIPHLNTHMRSGARLKWILLYHVLVYPNVETMAGFAESVTYQFREFEYVLCYHFRMDW